MATQSKELSPASSFKNELKKDPSLSNNIKEVVQSVMSLSVEGVFPDIDELFRILDVRSKCGDLTFPLALVLSVMSKGIQTGDPAVLKLFYEIWRDMFGFSDDEGSGFGQLMAAIKYIRFNGEN